MPKLTIVEYNQKREVEPPKNSQDFTTRKAWSADEKITLLGFLIKRSPKAVINEIYRLVKEHQPKHLSYEQKRTKKLNVRY